MTSAQPSIMPTTTTMHATSLFHSLAFHFIIVIFCYQQQFKPGWTWWTQLAILHGQFHSRQWQPWRFRAIKSSRSMLTLSHRRRAWLRLMQHVPARSLPPRVSPITRRAVFQGVGAWAAIFLHLVGRPPSQVLSVKSISHVLMKVGVTLSTLPTLDEERDDDDNCPPWWRSRLIQVSARTTAARE